MLENLNLLHLSESVNKIEVTRIFDYLMTVFEMYEHGINYVFSVDESGSSCVHKPASVIQLPKTGCDCHRFLAKMHHSVVEFPPWKYLSLLKTSVDERRFIYHLAQDFRLKGSALHSEAHTSNDGQRLKSCVRLKL
jgi:hypothetical protein